MSRWFALGLALALLSAACGTRAGAGPDATAGPTQGPAASPSSTGPVATTVVAATAQPSVAASPTAPAGGSAPTQSPTQTPAATGSPSPTVGSTGLPTPAAGALSVAQLKYRIVDRFGRLWYCDPDLYPVARADESGQAEAAFPEIQRDPLTLAAIIGRLGYPVSTDYSAERKLAIYRDWKMLAALRLDRAGDAYHFAARFTVDGRTGAQADGTIDLAGRIVVSSQAPAGPPNCPICLARGTRIDTPSGPVAVEELQAGTVVWTADPTGGRIAAPILAVGSMAAPVDHEIVHLLLADGRDLHASPAHPLADGRRLGAIAVGDVVDGALVLVAERLPYGGGTTFDLLPAGPTGTYWADGVPLASTIRR